MEHGRSPFEGSQRNPFAVDVSIGDVARPEDDAGDSSLSQNGSVAKIINAGWFALADAPHELRDEWKARVGFHRRARGSFDGNRPDLEMMASQQRGNFAENTGIRFTRERASVDSDF